jgi:hypothetical protein
VVAQSRLAGGSVGPDFGVADGAFAGAGASERVEVAGTVVMVGDDGAGPPQQHRHQEGIDILGLVSMRSDRISLFAEQI